MPCKATPTSPAMLLEKAKVSKGPRPKPKPFFRTERSKGTRHTHTHTQRERQRRTLSPSLALPCCCSLLSASAKPQLGKVVNDHSCRAEASQQEWRLQSRHRAPLSSAPAIGSKGQRVASRESSLAALALGDRGGGEALRGGGGGRGGVGSLEGKSVSGSLQQGRPFDSHLRGASGRRPQRPAARALLCGSPAACPGSSPWRQPPRRRSPHLRRSQGARRSRRSRSDYLPSPASKSCTPHLSVTGVSAPFGWAPCVCG